MEIGNMVFGHSRGEVKIERGIGYESELKRLFSAYAHDRDNSWREYGVEFENDVFEVHPYCWCDRDGCPQCDTGEQYNFYYKPKDIGIRWYKYPLRDSYFNRDVSLRDFVEIIDICIKSVE